MPLFLTRKVDHRSAAAGPERRLPGARSAAGFRQRLCALDELALKHRGLGIVVSGAPQVKRDDSSRRLRRHTQLGVLADRRHQERRQPRAGLVDAFREAAVGFVE
jgi:hypothetical protein